jgi:hypothetical protein
MNIQEQQQKRLDRAAARSHREAVKAIKLDAPASLAQALIGQIDEGRGEWIVGGSDEGEWTVTLNAADDVDGDAFDITMEQAVNGAANGEGADTHVAATKVRITVTVKVEVLEQRLEAL